MSGNWYIKDTNQLLGTAYAGPNQTLGFHWLMAVGEINALSRSRICISDYDKEMALGELINEMFKRPLHKGLDIEEINDEI